MMRLAMSSAAAGLLRSILARGGVDRDRILLTEFRSTDWQSLTFTGEQHKLALRISAPEASEVVNKIVDGLEEAEFALPGHVVADIAIAGEPEKLPDGSVALTIEALTVEA
jgi:hypothetical protein